MISSYLHIISNMVDSTSLKPNPWSDILFGMQHTVNKIYIKDYRYWDFQLEADISRASQAGSSTEE